MLWAVACSSSLAKALLYHFDNGRNMVTYHLCFYFEITEAKIMPIFSMYFLEINVSLTQRFQIMPSGFSRKRAYCFILTNTIAMNLWSLSNPMAWRLPNEPSQGSPMFTSRKFVKLWCVCIRLSKYVCFCVPIGHKGHRMSDGSPKQTHCWSLTQH